MINIIFKLTWILFVLVYSFAIIIDFYFKYKDKMRAKKEQRLNDVFNDLLKKDE